MRSYLIKQKASLRILSVLIPVLTMLSVGAEGEKNIVIMGASDLRGNIWSFSYEDNAEAANNGLVCAYNYARQVFNGVQ